jgi:threonine/homoserine/homoserine lactone efflux protein
MCACGCFVLAAVIAVVVYAVMHGLWLLAVMAVLGSAFLVWLGRKMFQKYRGAISRQ